MWVSLTPRYLERNGVLNSVLLIRNTLRTIGGFGGVSLQLIFRAGDLLHVDQNICSTWSKYDLNQFWKSSIGETKDIISSLFFDSTDPATEPFKRPQNYDLYTVSDRTVNISKKGNSANGWRNLIFQVENNWRLPHSNDYSTKDIGFKLCIVINSKYELGDDNI